jgi:threonylcarbamoyladenosine tRNA methylthiotransferase CDKAL1
MADLEDIGLAPSPLLDPGAGLAPDRPSSAGGGRSSAAPPTPAPTTTSAGAVRPVRIIRRAAPAPSSRDPSSSSAVDAPPPIPGTATVWLKTFGCAHNHADGETMAGVLAAQGHRVLMADAEGGDDSAAATAASSASSADVWVVNSCTVKTPSQTSVGRLAARARAAGIPLIVTGCVPTADKDAPELEGASLLGTQHTGRIAEVVSHALAGNTVHLLGRGPLPSLSLPRVRRNAHIEIVPISTGCLGRCTYCKTVHARGALGSHAPADIIARVAAAAADPRVREVWFSSEDVGAYGRDIGTDLTALLAGCLAALPADCRTLLRVGMTNPPYLLCPPVDGAGVDAGSAALSPPSKPGADVPLEGLMATIAADPRAFSFLHVPVQSGSDAVLGAMRREYTVADFEAVADAAARRGVTLATDIICGFPGESPADHAATLALLEKWRPPATHISRFHPRPGTPAARMPQLPRAVVAARSREVAALVDSWVGAWTHHVGRVVRAWAVGVAADGTSTVAHTRDYCQVLLDPATARPGDVVDVAVESAGRWSVKGRVVRVVFSPDGGGEGGAEVVAPPATPSPPPAVRPARAAAAESPAVVRPVTVSAARTPPPAWVLALVVAVVAAVLGGLGQRVRAVVV